MQYVLGVMDNSIGFSRGHNYMSEDSRAPEIRLLQDVLARRLQGGANPRILEAGCGSASHVRLPEGARLTGIDISQKQLDRNTVLDERLLGDLETFPLPSNKFDCTICWYVLEHLPHPELALRNLVQATKPGGLIILTVPNRNSFKGIMTRWTPHGFHVWTYRHIFQQKDAGTEDRGPFKTFLHPAVSKKGLKRFAAAHNLEECVFTLYTNSMIETGHRLAPVLFSIYSLLVWTLKFLSFQRYDGNLTDLLLVWRKP